MKVFGERIAPGFENRFEAELVHSEQSALQHIEVWEHEHFGRLLVLDGYVQTTEWDEFCYHEMLVHPALCSLEHLGRILVVGGGDGGTLRHALMHGPGEAVMCEIDEAVVRVSRQWLPLLSAGAFDDPRTRLVIADGAAFVAEHRAAFDAILVDSTDPIGPAAVLVSEGFYRACRRALRRGGVLVAQTGSPIYQGEELRAAVEAMRTAFPTVEVYLGFVPAYPGVLWSYTCGTDGAPVSSLHPATAARRLRERGVSTRFYAPEVHSAAFALPPFVQALCAPTPSASLPRS